MSVEAAPKSNNEVSKETKELEKAISERLEHQPKTGEQSKAEHAGEQPAASDLERIRDKINETSTKSTELAAGVAVPDDTSRRQVYIDKKGAHKAKLEEVQHNLSASERVMSKFVHAKPVTAISEATANTLARPTGLFWGGLFACLATATLYFTAKYIGFQYNYLLSFISFVGGYVIGLVVELLLRLVRRPAPSS